MNFLQDYNKSNGIWVKIIDKGALNGLQASEKMEHIFFVLFDFESVK